MALGPKAETKESDCKDKNMKAKTKGDGETFPVDNYNALIDDVIKDKSLAFDETQVSQTLIPKVDFH